MAQQAAAEQTAQTTRALLGFLIRESGVMRSTLLIFVVLASASRTGLIYLINETAERGGPSFGLFVALLAAAGTMLVATHLAKMGGVRLVHKLGERMRREITDRLLRADVSFFLGRDPSTIHHSASHHVDMVAGSTLRLADAVQAVLLLIFVLAYMLMQMPASVLATAIALALGIGAFLLNEGPATRAVAARHKAFNEYHVSLNDLLRGYKELRLRRARRADLAKKIDQEIDDISRLNEVAERHYSFGNITANGALAALLISVVTLLPLLGGADSVTILQILTLALFSFGPIETMIAGLPQLARAGVSYQVYTTLKETLSANAELPEQDGAGNEGDGREGDGREGDGREGDGNEGQRRARAERFEKVELRGVTVELTRDAGAGTAVKDRFTLGPIDLVLEPGQSVFITGGNGMGKSTLLSLLTGLRHPSAGEILVDGEPVTRRNIGRYRGLFAAVFSEFYIFRRLFGLSAAEQARLMEQAQEMGLAEGVAIQDGAFTDLALSTGQMRRLALSIALAEARPIIVLDEFAADQDPVRRRFFYEELVPRLASAGHCVVAVTHDEHCFGMADRLIRMADGKIVSDVVQRGADRAATRRA